MRASTVVATEISYNDGDRRYKAKIEFITASEWEKELRVLFLELQNVNEDQIIDGDNNKSQLDSAAVIALDKISAVYPSLSRREILQSSVENLLQDQSVSSLLGSTLELEANNPNTFSRKLKPYIDSKGIRKKSERNPRPRETAPKATTPRSGRSSVLFAYTVKAKALSTGAVLVDLPGVYDSNAARVAVAEEYMKKCSAHWIVAPINRAPDDKVARDLLS